MKTSQYLSNNNGIETELSKAEFIKCLVDKFFIENPTLKTLMNIPIITKMFVDEMNAFEKQKES